jgi:hypothetical protein
MTPVYPQLNLPKPFTGKREDLLQDGKLYIQVKDKF